MQHGRGIQDLLVDLHVLRQPPGVGAGLRGIVVPVERIIDPEVGVTVLAAGLRMRARRVVADHQVVLTAEQRVGARRLEVDTVFSRVRVKTRGAAGIEPVAYAVVNHVHRRAAHARNQLARFVVPVRGGQLEVPTVVQPVADVREQARGVLVAPCPLIGRVRRTRERHLRTVRKQRRQVSVGGAVIPVLLVVHAEGRGGAGRQVGFEDAVADGLLAFGMVHEAAMGLGGAHDAAP
ncbi:hypothetical protein D3C72_1117690 [compost metagenome]